MSDIQSTKSLERVNYIIEDAKKIDPSSVNLNKKINSSENIKRESSAKSSSVRNSYLDDNYNIV